MRFPVRQQDKRGVTSVTQQPAVVQRSLLTCSMPALAGSGEASTILNMEVE